MDSRHCTKKNLCTQHEYPCISTRMPLRAVLDGCEPEKQKRGTPDASLSVAVVMMKNSK